MTTNDPNAPRQGNNPPRDLGDTPAVPASADLQLAQQARAVPGPAVRKPAPGQTEAYPLFLFANGVAFDWKTVKLEKTAAGELAIVFPDRARIELVDSQKLVEALEKKGNGAIPPLDDSLPVLQQFFAGVEPGAGEQGQPASGHRYGEYDPGSIGQGIDHLAGLGNEEASTGFASTARTTGLDTGQFVGASTASENAFAGPVNEPPLATDDTYQLNYQVPFNQPAIGGLLKNDSDPNADPVTIASNGAVSHGTLVVGSDGQFSYTPDQGFIGTDSFTYTITDGNGGTSSATVMLDVGVYDDPPVLQPDDATTPEDTAVTIAAPGVLANDSDPENDPITIIGNSDPASGTVTLGSDGSYVYTPDADFNGTDSFAYTLSDGNGGSASTLVTITVTPTNDVPLATDNTAEVIEGGVVKTNVVIILDRSGSMNNDPGVEGYATRLAMTQAAIAKLLESGDVGSVLVVDFADTAATSGWTTVNGAVTYVNGITAFGPTNYDAALALTMSEYAQPHAAADRTVVYFLTDGDPSAGFELDAADTTAWETFLAANDIDRAFAVGIGSGVPNPSTQLEAVAWPNGDPENPAYALYDVKLVDVTNESFGGHVDGNVLTQDSGFGVDTFGGDGAGYIKSIEINGVVYTYDPGLDQITSINGTVAGRAITADTPLGGQLTFYFADGSGHLAGDYSYLSPGNVNANVDEVFPYVIVDVDGDQSTADLIMHVVDGDNRPPHAVEDSATTPEETPIAITVLGNDSDLDGNTLTVTGNTDPAHGSVVLGTDGVFTYTPDTDFNGTDSFVYTITDGAGATDTALVTLTVTGTNDPPDAIDDDRTTAEETPIAITVLSNDTDVDGEGLTVTANTDPSNGTVVLGTDGVFTYTPDTDFNGTDSFIYTITDANGGADTAQVTVTVTGTNDPPDAIDDTETTAEETPIAITVLSNDTDVDGEGLTVTGNTDPSNGSVTMSSSGVFTYTPNTDFNGTDSFIYTITDANGGADTAQVTVTVTGVNDPPDAIDDARTTAEETPVTITVLSNDTDVDGAGLTVTGNTDPSNGSVTMSSSGVFTYTPNTDFNGTDSFIYTITDANGGSDTAQVTVTVTGTNDPPDAVNDAYTTGEDAPLTVSLISSGVLGNDTDVDGEGLTVISNTTASFGSVSLATDGTFVYTPNANFFGTDTFTYTITDANGGSDTATVTITVTSADDPALPQNDAFTINEDTTLTTASWIANDSFPDGYGSAQVGGGSGPSHGSLTFNSSGTFTYTPTANYNGTDAFTYTVTDADGDTATATVTISVNPVNDPPDAVNDSANTVKTQPVQISVLGNDTDIDGGPLTVTSVSDGTNGTVTVNPDGTVTYTPTGTFTGTDSFTYTISDGAGGTDSATVTVTVQNVTLAGAVTINEIGLGAATGTVADVDVTGKNFIELRNFDNSAVPGNTIDDLKIEVVGPGGNKVTIDLTSGTTGNLGLSAKQYLVLYDAVDEDGEGIWAIYKSDGTIDTTGTYTYPGTYPADPTAGGWGMGDTTDDKLAVNLVQGTSSVDVFLANDPVTSGLTGALGWIGATFNASSGQAAAAALIGGALFDNSSFTGVVGDQDQTLATLGLVRPVAGTGAASSLTDGATNIFARTFSATVPSVAPGDTPPMDDGTAANWTTTNVESQGMLNHETTLNDANPQDPTDYFNPLQAQGTPVTIGGVVFDHAALAGQSVLDAAVLGVANLTGGRGNDYLYGSTAGNTITAGDNNDFLFGHSGDDTLLGGKGADLLVDVDGEDILRGGTGDDILVADAAEFGDATPGSDLGDLLVGDELIDTGAAGTVVSGKDVIYGGTQADMIFGDNAIVAAADQAGFSDDPIAYYNSLDNAGRKQFLIDNQNGNGQTDNIDGGGGNDVILGGGGADQILGGLGDDIIHGGMGSDQMDGGTGADKFVFVPGDLSGGAVDTIYNFQTGAGGDALDIADLLSGYTPATKADYIKVVDDGSGNAKLQVDANGSAGGSAYVDVAVLVGVSPSTTVDDLINDGNLIVTH